MCTVITDEEALRNISENVKRLRGDKSLSQLARELSTASWRCYPATVQHIELGRHMPGAGLLSRLAEVFGVTMDDLIRQPESRPKKAS